MKNGKERILHFFTFSDALYMYNVHVHVDDLMHEYYMYICLYFVVFIVSLLPLNQFVVLQVRV